MEEVEKRMRGERKIGAKMSKERLESSLMQYHHYIKSHEVVLRMI